MPLFVPNDVAYTEYILPDILKIVDRETTVGDTKAPDPAWIQITYNTTKLAFAQTQFFNIVRGTPAFSILLRYVSSDFILPEDPDPQTGHVLRIAETQGATYGPGSGNANPAGSGVILVYLDAYNDAGANYWARGQDGSQIFSPRWVALFHELSHALHIADGLVTDATPEAQEDALTIGDENKLRAQYQPQHPWLKQRSLNEEGGPGAQDPEPDFNNPTSKSHCFIVSAAYGSPQAAEVRRFQDLRDTLLRGTELGNEFFSQILREYYEFSPLVSTEMNDFRPLRDSIAKLVVEPLINLFNLLENYVRGGWQRTDFGNQVERALMSFLKGLASKGLSTGQVGSISRAIEEVNARLRTKIAVTKETAPPPPPKNCSEPILVLDYLARVVEGHTTTSSYIHWAILIPLTIYWSALARLTDRRQRVQSIGSYVSKAFDDWLGSAPIPPSCERLDGTAMRNSLRCLSESIFTIPSVRRTIGLRLLEKCGSRTPFKFEKMLLELGYLSKGNT